MPTVCVAPGCSNQRDESRGIALHNIPFFDDERAEAKRRRKKWVDFVKQKRAKWEPSKRSVICSVHFKPEDFERRFVLAEPESKPMIRWLRKDEISCCVYSTIHTVGETAKEKPLSDREKCMAIKAAMASQKAVSGSDRLRDEPRSKRKKTAKVSATAVTSAAAVAEDSSAENAESATATTEDGKPTVEPTTSQKDVSSSDRLRDELRAKRKKVAKVSATAVTSAAAVDEDSSAENAESATATTKDGKPTVERSTLSADREHVDDHQEELPAGHDQPTGESSVQQGNCSNCGVLSNTIRKLKNRIVSLEKNVRKWKTSNRRSEYQLKATEPKVNQEVDSDGEEMAEEKERDAEEGVEDVEEDVEEEADEVEEVEEDGDGGSEYETENDTETTGTETDEDYGDKSNRLSLKNTNLRTEPKHIVFLTQLLLLFKFCHTCKADSPTVEVSENGTEAIVKTYCNDPKCNKKDTWYSQPLMPGSRIPAGNFLLCLSILLAGGSATKVFRAFSHMGLGCVSLNTFFKYQRTKLFPTIHLYWQNYQSKVLAKLKSLQIGITIAGDGRHDSMGHSAKFGAYTIFCCTISP